MPTAVLYRILIDPERCKGCELCVEVCPRKVLAMGKTMNSRGYHYAVSERPEECIGCLQCADICPDVAIEVEQELE
jgi:2-oxoglutarate ferredoxin oxidoreductase subunit delta